MVKTASSIADVFSVVSATGAAADADSLPTGTLYVDGVANAAAVTVTNIAGTGLYSWSVTMPSLTAGQTVAVVIALTVGGVASHGVVYRAQADTNWQSETHARIGAPAGASIAADLAAIEAQTDDIGTAGAGLSNMPWNAAWDAEVQSEVADALVAYDAATGSDVPAVGAIADAVWDEALAGHLTAGTAGKALSDAGAAGDPWSTDLDAGGYAAGSAGDILLDLQGGTVYATGSTPNTDADLYIRRGDTVAVTIGDLTGLAAGWDVLWVTIKRSEHDADSAAILQVRLNVATPTLPGLIYIDGQTPTDAGVLATDAWISDVDAGADTLVLNIKPAASLLLPATGALYWDVQQLDGTTLTTLATGERTAEIGGDVTRAVV